LWKEDIVRLNGFDELSYGISAIPDDMDWTWRLPMAGIKIESCKNVANMMHLWHKIYDRGDAKKALLIMHQNRKEKKIICEYGLNTHVV
jgi:GT2 family glycosyltransferase